MPAGTVLEWNDERGVQHRVAVLRSLVAGRDASCDIVLGDRAASRRHARILPAAGGIFVEVRQSSAVTVRSAPNLKRVFVPHGREFRLGRSTFRVLPLAAHSRDSGRSVQIGPVVAVGAGTFAALALLVFVSFVAFRGRAQGPEPGQGAEQTVVANAGGKVEHTGGLSVEIPPNSLLVDATISISVGTPPEANFEVTAAGDAYHITSSSEFASPVTLTVPYRREFAGAVALATFDGASLTWVVVPSVEDTTRHVLIAEVDHFSWWRAVAAAPGDAAGLLLPYDERDTGVVYTGGPHGWDDNPYDPVDLSTGSAIDFAGGSGVVLTMASGIYKGWDDEGDKAKGAGFWVLIEHADGLQVGYWHLDRAKSAVYLDGLRSGMTLPAGFPIGVARASGGQGSVHLHVELSRGLSTKTKGGSPATRSKDGLVEADRLAIDFPNSNGLPFDANDGDPKTPGPITIDSWSFWMHRVPGAPLRGFKYQGSATRGDTTLTTIRMGNGVDSTAVVASNFDKRVTSEMNVTPGQRGPATVFAFEKGPEQTHLPSTNRNFCSLKPADNRCDGIPPQVLPDPSPEPRDTEDAVVGGVWVKVPAAPTGEIISLEARAYSRPLLVAVEVDWVNFTIDNGTAWSIACHETRPVRDDVYACQVDLAATGIGPGQDFVVSFDVFGSDGSHNLAPNGLKKLNRGPGSPGPTPKPTAAPTARPTVQPTTKPGTRTQVIEYQPSSAGATPGEPVTCSFASLAIGRPGFWRCGAPTYDPCLRVPGRQEVLCGLNREGRPGSIHALKEPLPSPNIGSFDPAHAWFAQRTDGTWCEFVQGAAGVWDGSRRNYQCDDGWVVLGDLETGEVWTGAGARLDWSGTGKILERKTFQFSQVIR